MIILFRKSKKKTRSKFICTYQGRIASSRKATEAIKTVIANYSNSDGYSYFRSQVGAVTLTNYINKIKFFKIKNARTGELYKFRSRASD